MASVTTSSCRAALRSVGRLAPSTPSSTARVQPALSSRSGRAFASLASTSTARSRFAFSSAARSAPLLARSIFVQTQTTPNPNSLQFIPGTPVLSSGGTHEFLTPSSALSSPLALRLMGLEGVTSVFYGPDFVSVQKAEDTPWAFVKPEIFSCIMEHFSSGQPLFRDRATGEAVEEGEPEDTRILDTDSEVVAMVKDLLASRIRPSIMEDGGDLEFMGMDEESGVVKVKLKGSCRGCSSSAVTLKSGIERMLMHYVPEVKTVEQVLDDQEALALDEFEKFEAKLASKSASTSSTSSAA